MRPLSGTTSFSTGLVVSSTGTSGRILKSSTIPDNMSGFRDPVLVGIFQGLTNVWVLKVSGHRRPTNIEHWSSWATPVSLARCASLRAALRVWVVVVMMMVTMIIMMMMSGCLYCWPWVARATSQVAKV